MIKTKLPHSSSPVVSVGGAIGSFLRSGQLNKLVATLFVALVALQIPVSAQAERESLIEVNLTVRKVVEDKDGKRTFSPPIRPNRGISSNTRPSIAT